MKFIINIFINILFHIINNMEYEIESLFDLAISHIMWNSDQIMPILFQIEEYDDISDSEEKDMNENKSIFNQYKDHRGQTLLIKSIIYNRVDVCIFLLSKKVDIEI